MFVISVSAMFDKMTLGTTLLCTIRLYLQSPLTLIKCPARQLSMSMNVGGSGGRFASLSSRHRPSVIEVTSPPMQKDVDPLAHKDCICDKRNVLALILWLGVKVQCRRNTSLELTLLLLILPKIMLEMTR
ncbi:unnamed protein product [Vicia faba]|uniref:Uncharacterized protein n=1 Tax=Vicia faba TaxID=3906 RepID=A0AAV1B346_VICFA|nr:unnamed protein product [Vicia faba]